jgi:ATP-binding protein involved in chromosome partitioning
VTAAAAPVTEQQVMDALRVVQDPDLGRDIVTLGFVKKVRICDGNVNFDVELTTPACPVKDKLRADCERAVAAIPGATNVVVNMTSVVRRPIGHTGPVLPEVKNVIAVASGKGGVGKSTVAANLACALKQAGAAVGLMDCDVYGPSQAMMFGINRQPVMNAAGDKIEPPSRYGIKLMSMAFIANEKTPVIWRGPMVHSLLREFLTRVDWGALDYLVMDLPPGTGDAQLTLTQTAPLSGEVIVTTPQDVSLIDARKGLRMFQEVKVPILGVVENMSSFACEKCGHRHEIFRHGGAARLCEEHNVPFLGEVPIDTAVPVGGDEGEPIVMRNPSSPAGKALVEIAGKVAARLSVISYQGKEVPSLKL